MHERGFVRFAWPIAVLAIACSPSPPQSAGGTTSAPSATSGPQGSTSTGSTVGGGSSATATSGGAAPTTAGGTASGAASSSGAGATSGGTGTGSSGSSTSSGGSAVSGSSTTGAGTTSGTTGTGGSTTGGGSPGGSSTTSGGSGGCTASLTPPVANGGSSAGVTDPSQTGPDVPGSSSGLTYADAAGGSVTFALYYPTGPGLPPGPLVLVSHGFLQSGADFANWGTLLASRGFVAVVSTWNSISAPTAPGDAVLANELLTYLAGASQTDPSSPLYGKVDPTRQALVGHSAGGLMVFLAAAANPAISVVVGLDPVDDSNGSAAAAARSFQGLGVVLQADPSSCNANNSDQACIYASLPGPKLIAHVAGATHCDCEDPTDITCLFCGSTSPARQQEFKRYALAALTYGLACDTSVESWLDGPALESDPLLAGQANQGIRCIPPAAPPDAG